MIGSIVQCGLSQKPWFSQSVNNCYTSFLHYQGNYVVLIIGDMHNSGLFCFNIFVKFQRQALLKY